MTSVNRNRMIGAFEDAFERGQSDIANSAKASVSSFASATKGQVAGSSSNNLVANDHGINEASTNAQSSSQPQMTDAERVEFLSDLYGKNTNKANSGGNQKSPQKGAGDVKQALGIPQKDPNEGKTPEEIAKIESLRRQLHSDYYQELLKKSKSKEEPAAEKLEREEEEKKMVELEEKKNQSTPAINPQMVKQGTGERVLSTVG